MLNIDKTDDKKESVQNEEAFPKYAGQDKPEIKDPFLQRKKSIQSFFNRK